MACFGSDSSYLLDALLLSCFDSKKRKSGPQQSAERKRRKDSRGLAKWMTSIPCVIMESSPSPPCRRDEVLDQISEIEISESPARLRPQQKILFDVPFLDEATVELVLADLEKRKSSLDVRTSYKRLLAIKNRSGQHDTWTSKYAPTNSCALLGNYMALFKLKSWLNDWKLFIEKNDVDESCENKGKSTEKSVRKNKEKVSGRKSYLVDSDSEEDLFEIPAPEEMPLTGFMVYGPPGVGKTAAIHALAEELGFTVLEINPASCKDAKQILIQSLEATQSHRVQVKSTTVSQFFSQTDRESGRKTDRRANTLILIDDADVLPQGEESFITAVESMLKKTKRPVIFTISGLSKIRLIQTESLEVGDLDFVRQPLIDIACYISLVALAECTVLPYVEAFSKVQATNGDLRASLNIVQFWSARNWLSLPVVASPDDSVMILEKSLVEINSVTSHGFISKKRVSLDLLNSEVLPEISEIMENLLENLSSDHVSDSGISSLQASQKEGVATNSFSSSKETARPEICDHVTEKSAFDATQKLLKECQEAEIRSVLATITSARDAQLTQHSVSSNRPLAGVCEDVYEESATLECRFSTVERSTEISREYEKALFSSEFPSLEDSSTNRMDSARSGRMLFHRYGQYNPQTHVRGYQFGREHWSFIRGMAQSEFMRRQSEEQVKRRRLRFYNYLGPNTLHLSDELLNQLHYSIGEDLLQKDEFPCNF